MPPKKPAPPPPAPEPDIVPDIDPDAPLPPPPPDKPAQPAKQRGKKAEQVAPDLLRNLKQRVLRWELGTLADIKENPLNWRKHPEQQRNILRAVMERIGFVGGVLVYKEPDGWYLVDGHLRKEEIDPEEKVWIGYTDLSRQEANYLLTVLDPIGDLAEADETRLAALLSNIAQTNEAEATFLSNMAHAEYCVFSEDAPPPDWLKEKPLPVVMKMREQFLYNVLIECVNEKHQAELLERFEQEGLKCRALTS